MTLRVSAFLLLLLGLTACLGMPQQIEYTIEVPVTREVTRVVTVVVGENQTLADDQPTAIHTPTPLPVTVTPAASPSPEPFPSPQAGRFVVAQQQFQNGAMLWLQPIDQIWVLSIDDEGKQIWEIYEDNFEEGMPEFDPEIQSPRSGLYQPVRGFGMLWRQNESVRDQLGWALGEEVGYTANYEYHYGGTVENGEYVQGPGYHLVQTISGEIYRFNEGIMTWEVINDG